MFVFYFAGLLVLHWPSPPGLVPEQGKTGRNVWSRKGPPRESMEEAIKKERAARQRAAPSQESASGPEEKKTENVRG